MRHTLTPAIQPSNIRKGAGKKTSKAAILAVKGVLDTVKSSLEDSKAEDIVTIDIQGRSALGDYMIVASGRSQRHVGAIANHLLRALKSSGTRSVKVEGQQNADWVLVDAGDIIIHLFRPEVREFYGLEKLWQMPASEEVN